MSEKIIKIIFRVNSRASETETSTTHFQNGSRLKPQFIARSLNRVLYFHTVGNRQTKIVQKLNMRESVQKVIEEKRSESILRGS